MKENMRRCGQDRVTRRSFLVAGAAVGAGWAPALAADDPVIEFARESCGDEAARLRVLVAYASLCGATGEIAAAIGKKLCEAHLRVDVRHLPEVTDLDGYEAFVIGSPIHAGTWMAEAMRFLCKRQDALAKAPVAYFIDCMALSSDKEESRQLARGYVERPLKLAPKIKPVALGMFAGKVDYAKMPERYHAIMRRIVPQDADARNWEAIGKWGEELAGQLTGR